ncbi:hypothetical protein [Streptomyces sp. NPDC048603]|uniref:hypothetical protein n=1 Tax=Streptomyces sp. NPDC048603 TaxID=3365577 RepID=UPI00371C40BC
MAMVGLFWITPEAVYVGSPPTTDGSCVRLTGYGVQAVEPGASRTWAWKGLRSVAVQDVPRRGPARILSGFWESLLFSLSGGEAPPEMTVRLETGYGPEELRVYSAAACGYGPDEAALSGELLSRFAAGAASPRALGAWARDHGGDGTPRARVRTELLRAWTEG